MHSFCGRFLSRCGAVQSWLLLSLALGVGASANAQVGGDPAFVVHERPYAQVIVDAWSAGAAVGNDSLVRCSVLFGVNSKGERTAWPQACPPEVEADVRTVTDRWQYRVGEVGSGEVFARFHAVFVYPADAAPYVEIANEIVERPPESYPAGLVMRTGFNVLHRPPFRLRGVSMDQVPRGERCEVEVEVAANGKPQAVEVTSCPDLLQQAIGEYVRRWRWSPLEQNGEGFVGKTTVVVRIP